MAELHLFIDGSPERMALAYQRLPDEIRNNSIWCKNVEEGLSVLKDYRERLTTVSFEHNLTEYTHDDSRRTDSGMEIVRWLEKQQPEDWNTCIFNIHGWSFSDDKMHKRLAHHGFHVDRSRFGG